MASIRKLGTDPNTPLLKAAKEGTLNRVQDILDTEIHPDNKPAYGYTPLHAAILGNHVEVVRVLLEAGASTETLFKPSPKYFTGHPSRHGFGGTPLHMAISMESVELVGLLLKAKADLRKGWDRSSSLDGGYGSTPLHIAVARGNIEIVCLILSQPDAEVDIPNGKGDRGGETPLEVAVAKACGDSTSLQSARSSLAQTTDEASCQFWKNTEKIKEVQSHTETEIVRTLLEAGAAPDASSPGRDSPLYRALAKNQQGIASLLLSYGADLPAVRRANVVHDVVRSSGLGGLYHLQRLGLSLDEVDDQGRTPLLAALAWGPAPQWRTVEPVGSLQQTVEFLLSQEVEVNAADEKGNTALHYAVQYGLDEIAGVLLQAGGDMCQPNLAGTTPKHWAAEGKLETFHTPVQVRNYQQWATECDLPMSDLVETAMQFYRDLQDLKLNAPEIRNAVEQRRRNLLDDARKSAQRPPDQAVEVPTIDFGAGIDWFHQTVFPLYDQEFRSNLLVAAFQEAKHEELQRTADRHLLSECLAIEMAGPERGYLVTGIEQYTGNLLAAAVLWLRVRDHEASTDSDYDLIARAQGIRQLVKENLVDRIQAYVAVTILLRPAEADREAGEAGGILDDLWERAKEPARAQEETSVATFLH